MVWKSIKIAVFSLVLLAGCKSKQQEEVSKTNVIFILVDDLGWMDLGCYGSSFYETPNLDRLAGQSARFTNAYAASPVCSPTRAAILTGKHPTRVGITDWIPGNDPKNRPLLGPEDMHQLPLEETTLAETLKEDGYMTFFAGKWHLGNDGFFPENHGFDINMGGHHRGSPPGGYYSPYKNPNLSDGPEGEYLTDRLVDESLQFIQANQQNPFLLYLSFYTVHTPIQASKKHIEKFEAKRASLQDSLPRTITEGLGYTVQNQSNADYASMVYAMDENVGRILEALEELSLMDNTLIVFTSDNGGLSTLQNPTWNAPTSVLPLRGGKGWAYEGGIRVPLLIKKPGNNQSLVVDAPVTSMDLYPTILDILGMEARPEQHVDGANLNPLWDGSKEQPHGTLFWDFPHYHGSGWTPGCAIRKGDWKLIQFYEEDRLELYNLKDDIGELNDLAEKFPEKLQEMSVELERIKDEIGAKTPMENINFETKQGI
ncbi:sulfatase [Flagellimonas myxillae]|uniref:sulfatase n=1 Tax=Flagellimonas myxillae TaxID=2942214 RepID=UPI00201F326D|nr:sulfatase [Muricauda myxillae]MCL6265445.1 sulfatase [Muricauda myxillae]